MKKFWRWVFCFIIFSFHCYHYLHASCVNTSCSNDSKGKLDDQTISWNPVSDGDLEGYRIYKCSSLDPLTCVQCRDVGNFISSTLSVSGGCLYADKETFIRIKAYDTGGLESSLFSNPVQFDMSGWSCIRHVHVCQTDPLFPYDCPECEDLCFSGDLYNYESKFPRCI